MAWGSEALAYYAKQLSPEAREIFRQGKIVPSWWDVGEEGGLPGGLTVEEAQARGEKYIGFREVIEPEPIPGAGIATDGIVGYQQGGVMEDGFKATPTVFQAIPGAAAAAGITLPAWLISALGMAGGAYTLWQALGGGEGEGLFGLDILGGSGEAPAEIGDIPLGGPGLKEPPASMLIKQWVVNYGTHKLQYYLVRMPNGRRKIALWSSKTGQWKSWSFNAPRLAVIGKNMPRHQMLTRLRKNLRRHSADARTILKITSPKSLRAMSRPKYYSRRRN